MLNVTRLLTAEVVDRLDESFDFMFGSGGECPGGYAKSCPASIRAHGVEISLLAVLALAYMGGAHGDAVLGHAGWAYAIIY